MNGDVRMGDGLDIPPIEIGTAFALRFDTGIEVPALLDFPFDDSIVGEGWHQWEMSDAGSFRWMGKVEHATVEFVVDRRQDLTIDLGIYQAMAPVYIHTVRVFVDDGEEPLPHDLTSEGLSFLLPAKLGDPAVTTLRISTAPGMVREPDTRRLALSFSHLRARPANSGVARQRQHLALGERLAEQLRLAGHGWPLTLDGRPIAIAGA